MAKITSKLQVTVPKAIADAHQLRAGDEIVFESAGDVIRIVPPTRRGPLADVAARLRLFDQATQRQRLRERGLRRKPAPVDRGWTREELYRRGRAR